MTGATPAGLAGARPNAATGEERSGEAAGRDAAEPIRVAVISNGNAFSTLMLRPLFRSLDIRVVGAVLVRIPPGAGGRAGRLWRIGRKTGSRYARHKLGTLVVPQAVSVVSGRPAFLDRLAAASGTPWISAGNANDDRVREFLRRAGPDVLLSVSTPQRISEELLGIPRLAAVNIHWALLPRYAGIAPYFWVLRNGEERTGLTVHLMAPELDVGPVLRRREIEIRSDETMLGLQLRLAWAGGEELLAAIQAMPGTLADAREQDLSSRSYFTWPSSSDVAALRARGRRLARMADYRELARLIKG
ncbi:MAG: formyltransferase family protein [Actinomycetota bacterium]